jgi:hypothetical protein
MKTHESVQRHNLTAVSGKIEALRSERATEH